MIVLLAVPPSSQPHYSATVRTEFLPPNGFSTLSLAFGSGSHWPSTTKRYSWRPGPTLRRPAHRPLPAGASGVCSGCQLLNEPATNTCFAAGFTNSRTIRGGGGAAAFTATGFTGSAGGASTVFAARLTTCSTILGSGAAAAFTTTGFTASAGAASTFANPFFDFFAFFIMFLFRIPTKNPALCQGTPSR